MNDFPEYVVFNGGGIKGLSLVGVLAAMEDLGWTKEIKGVAGSSVGAIMGLAFVLGLNARDIYTIGKKHMDRLKIVNIEFKLTKFFRSYGMNNGLAVQEFLEEFFDYKGIKYTITFKELYSNTKIDFHVTGTNVTKKKCEIFNYVTHPNMSVLLAVLISSRIPFIFEPIEYNQCMYVDGSMSKDYPIDIFPRKRQIGFFLEKHNRKKDIKNVGDYFLSILEIVNHLYLKADMRTYEDQTVLIPCPVEISSGQFQCSETAFETLVANGYLVMMAWLQNHWSKYMPISRPLIFDQIDNSFLTNMA